MKKTLVILQSNYIPWKGYFDLMNAADEFVIFDEVQFTRRDWRNRNKLIVGGELKWMTIPVESKGRYDAAICEIEVSDPQWAKKHWTTIQHAYGKAPFFAQYRDRLEAAYKSAEGLSHLSAINRLFLEMLADLLSISTPMSRSEEIPRTTEDPAGRLLEICKAKGATTYLSGPAAKAYIDPVLFRDAGIELGWADYRGYPSYPQAHEPFEHGVSVIDLLMRVGPEARDYLKTGQDRRGIFAAS